MEITRNKWIAGSREAPQAIITYRVVKRNSKKIDVALTDEATGYNGTASLMIEDDSIKITDEKGEWVTWTRKP